jgi:hypothetical protein
MADAPVEDLLSLDRDVARAATALSRWRASLALEPDSYAEESPIEPVRHIATRSTWLALGASTAVSADASLREGLRRWVYALLQARLAHDDEVAVARARTRPQAIVERDGSRLVSWADAWRGALGARTVEETSKWLDAAKAAAGDVRSPLLRRAQRRVEIARRLGLEHPWAPIVRVSPEALRASAAAFLDATDEMSREVWSESVRGADAESGPPGRLRASMARDAGDGWPARLTQRWLHDVFHASSGGLVVDVPALPARLGAASFGRALCTFGYAVRLAVSSRSMPFALAREPAFVAAHRLAYVFGALAADPEFHGRVLNVSRRVAAAQARTLARTALQEARLQAARILLADDVTPASRAHFEEITARLLGAPLDDALRGAWPDARDDEPARWVGLIEAVGLRTAFRDRFDVDWFRNPRAWSDLREQGAAAADEAFPSAPAVTAQVEALARAFEGALG